MKSHVITAVAAAIIGAGAMHLWSRTDISAAAQTPAANPGSVQAELFKTTMEDVLGRVVTIRMTTRAPGNSSGPHRHPGSHTFGYVLEGTYEVKIDDGPLQRLGPGGVFYEKPNALHAISRNGSQTSPVKYLIVSISDPTKPQTVSE